MTHAVNVLMAASWNRQHFLFSQAPATSQHSSTADTHNNSSSTKPKIQSLKKLWLPQDKLQPKINTIQIQMNILHSTSAHLSSTNSSCLHYQCRLNAKDGRSANRSSRTIMSCGLASPYRPYQCHTLWRPACKRQQELLQAVQEPQSLTA